MPSPIFAFFNNGYYFNNGHHKTESENRPYELETAFNESSGPSSILAVYGGAKDQFFLRTTRGVRARGVPEGFNWDDVKYIAWGPNDELWLKLKNGRVKHEGLSSRLKDNLEEYKAVQVSFGPDGNWFMVTEGGGYRYSGGYADSDLVKFIKARDRSVWVKNVVLCPWDIDFYWAELTDGSVEYTIKKKWKNDVQRIIN